ncbi:hypothetical protein R6L23_12195 [Streptomyces sp. SR27]|uniref:hypothetical protein n=1 Tax=Streptomyces sp. SR27 TaxID=3076630 RepID=UPI00295B9815|nr:hypothetical protein [Streptomyces sp. SR27]MDV9188966.1 hypothetical protein [Streptomyces sp. SR27]
MRSPRPTRRRGPRRFAALLLCAAASPLPQAAPAGAAAPPPAPGALQAYDISSVYSAGVSSGGFLNRDAPVTLTVEYR